MEMEMLHRIEAYLRRSEIAASRFGRDSLRDPHLVGDLRRGRELRAKTSARLSAYLDMLEKDMPPVSSGCATPSSEDRRSCC